MPASNEEADCLIFKRAKLSARSPDRDELSRRKTGDQNAPAMISRRQQKETQIWRI
jgi:hypothetical protein